jgi:hypothetical protein
MTLRDMTSGLRMRAFAEPAVARVDALFFERSLLVKGCHRPTEVVDLDSRIVWKGSRGDRAAHRVLYRSKMADNTRPKPASTIELLGHDWHTALMDDMAFAL